MKVIRAKRPVFVPANPEKPDSVMKPVGSGLIALIPSEFHLPEGSHEIVHEFEIGEKSLLDKVKDKFKG